MLNKLKPLHAANIYFHQKENTMKEKRKYTTAEIIMLIFCSLGLLLMATNKFIDTELNLFSIALGLNGVGLAAFIYSQGSNKAN